VSEPTKAGYVLKEEWQYQWEQFDSWYEGCTCHTGNPPCGFCTHPGNPIGLLETEDAWVYVGGKYLELVSTEDML
jgi:hypothetical protein